MTVTCVGPSKLFSNGSRRFLDCVLLLLFRYYASIHFLLIALISFFPSSHIEDIFTLPVCFFACRPTYLYFYLSVTYDVTLHYTIPSLVTFS